MVLVQQSDDSLCLSDCKLLLLEDGVRQVGLFRNFGSLQRIIYCGNGYFYSGESNSLALDESCKIALKECCVF